MNPVRATGKAARVLVMAGGKTGAIRPTRMDKGKGNQWVFRPTGPRPEALCCLFCCYTSPQPSQLENHMIRMHPTRLNDDDLRNPPPKFKCRQCGFSTRQAPLLVNHEMMHIVKSAHQCPSCTFSAPEEGKLNRHLERDHPVIPVGDQDYSSPFGEPVFVVSRSRKLQSLTTSHQLNFFSSNPNSWNRRR